MRLTPLQITLVALVALAGVGGGAWFLAKRDDKPSAPVAECTGLLGRPLRVGIVTWPGYAGGIVANDGFKPSKESIYFRRHKLCVEFMLMEDVDARAKAFAHGGK